MEPIAEETVYVFEEGEAQVLLFYNDTLMKEFCTSSADTPERAVASAIEHANRIIAEFGIKDSDPAVVCVERRMRRVRKKKAKDSYGHDVYRNCDCYHSDPFDKRIVWNNRQGMLT